MSDWEPVDELRGLLYNKLSALAPNDGVREWELVDDTVDAIMRDWLVTRETVRRKTDMQPMCRLVIMLPWCPTMLAEADSVTPPVFAENQRGVVA